MWNLVIVLIVILLTITTKTTLEKGFSLWKKESDEFENEASSSFTSTPNETTRLVSSSSNSNVISTLNAGDGMSYSLKTLLEEEKETDLESVNVIVILV